VTIRRRRGALLSAVAVLATASASSATPPLTPPPRPNVLLILADDLGYGDLSSYGATGVDTPQIDRLAKEGIRFTDFYAAANTCSPSRAALLTGRYPLRSGVNAVLFHDTPDGLPPSEITVAEVLRDAGYYTGMIGKWHLGQMDEYMPWNQGFDEFFGVPYSNDEKNFFVYDGRRRIPDAVDQSALIRRYTDRALSFLDRRAHQAQPFFLYFAHNAPHVPLHPAKEFAGSSRRGAYGDVVQELDSSVGQLLDKLAELGIANDTLVIFASDNGPWLSMRDWGGSAGGLRDGKLSTFEGGHRVPALARWPAHIPAGVEARGVANLMDWLPTLTELAGGRLPEDRVIDGRSLSAVLQGTGEREATPFFYARLRMPVVEEQAYEIGAVRDGKWKLKLPQRGYYPELLEPLMKLGMYRHGRLLFDLEADPGEQRNLADELPEIVARLQKEIDDFEAHASPATPVRVSAAPEDHRGWERMWRGVGAAAAVVVASTVVLLCMILRVLRRMRSRV
jgi:arylsulfatase A-like enzyme